MDYSRCLLSIYSNINNDTNYIIEQFRIAVSFSQIIIFLLIIKMLSDYLEDFCGPLEDTKCDNPQNVVFLSGAGSSSGLVLNGFRETKPTFTEATRCCITMKTLDLSRFNVQLDEVTIQQSGVPGAACDNFVRVSEIIAFRK